MARTFSSLLQMQRKPRSPKLKWKHPQNFRTMEHSEYKDKHFHVVVSYWKEDGSICNVEVGPKARLTDEQIAERVKELNENDDHLERKIFPVDKELSQVIYFLTRERARDKQSYADRVQELINNIRILRDDVEETFEAIKEEIEREKLKK